jgi:hypothetical protein
LIADQRPGAESERAADRSTGSGAAHSRADDSARRGASQGANSGTFLAGCQFTASAPGEN